MPLYSPEQTALTITVNYHRNGQVFHRDVLFAQLYQHAFHLNYLFNGSTVPNYPVSLFGDGTLISLTVRPTTYAQQRLTNTAGVERDGRGDDPVDSTIRHQYVQVETQPSTPRPHTHRLPTHTPFLTRRLRRRNSPNHSSHHSERHSPDIVYSNPPPSIISAERSTLNPFKSDSDEDKP